MTPTQQITPEFVEAFPTPLQPAVLYVSISYRTTAHLCCCGCGEEVIAPLGPAQWALTYDGDTVSLHPSIGNWTLPCKSHYVIRRNQVLTRRRFTTDEIVENREQDRDALAHYDGVTRNVDLVSGGTPTNSLQSDSKDLAPLDPTHHSTEQGTWWTRVLHHLLLRRR